MYRYLYIYIQLSYSNMYVQQTGCSDSEFDRVSGEIRRVSMSADSPHIQSIVKQLQV
jgi:hypothetical protein